ncbi:hypothetical protein NKI85_22425 [Mesorhizobium sp. M0571]
MPGIRDGLDKEIIWADPMIHAKTPLAIVYIHGFSASKGEVRPLPDEVADQLDANLFYTRLTGHGQDGAAIAQGSVNAWINDYEEALAIGRAIGDKVIVIAHLDRRLAGGLGRDAAKHIGRCRGDRIHLAEFRRQGCRRRTADPTVGQTDRRARRRQGAQLRAAQRAA